MYFLSITLKLIYILKGHMYSAGLITKILKPVFTKRPRPYSCCHK